MRHRLSAACAASTSRCAPAWICSPPSTPEAPAGGATCTCNKTVTKLHDQTVSVPSPTLRQTSTVVDALKSDALHPAEGLLAAATAPV